MLAGMPELADAPLDNISVEAPKVRDFGDFSTNAAMVLARPLGKSPREIADLILPHIAKIPAVADASIAGPGFINIRLRDEFIISAINEPRAPNPEPPLTICLDYGSYNVAKALHIGHLRGGITGDTFYRILHI